MKNIRILVPVIVLCAGLFAVINTFEDSYTRINNIDTPFESITIPEVDIDALIREDEENAGPGVPFRYAQELDVDFNIQSSGIWEQTVDG